MFNRYCYCTETDYGEVDINQIKFLKILRKTIDKLLKK